jgi:hypothetical protein
MGKFTISGSENEAELTDNCGWLTGKGKGVYGCLQIRFKVFTADLQK